jgi:hypothetical protein
MDAEGRFRGIMWYEKAKPDIGKTCGECGRLMKVYHRRLSRAIVRGLIRLYRLHQSYPGTQAFHVRQFDLEGERLALGVLSHWGLVDEVKRHHKDQRTSGMWALTDFGAQFVRLEVKVPLYAMVKWRSQLLGFTGPYATAKECLEQGGKFSYAELMGWKPQLTQADLL